MTQRGFALLAVLWVITALSAITGAGLLVARLGSDTTRNRVLLARSEWAREACGEILQARYSNNARVRQLDSIDLGRGTWCRATLEDPSAKLNLNTAEPDALLALFKAIGLDARLGDSVIAARREGGIYDVRQVPGIDSVAIVLLLPFVTTRGTGAVNVNAATAEVLQLLPGITEEAVGLIVSRRASRPLQNADELAGALSRSSRAVLLTSYAEFLRTAVFTPPQLIATLEGGVRGTALVARATLTVVPVVGRLAVIRRETE